MINHELLITETTLNNKLLTAEYKIFLLKSKYVQNNSKRTRTEIGPENNIKIPSHYEI